MDRVLQKTLFTTILALAFVCLLLSLPSVQALASSTVGQLKPGDDSKTEKVQTNSLRLILWPTQAEYSVEEEITFDVLIENSGKFSVRVDDEFVQHWNLFIEVKDESGVTVEYATYWRRIRRISPTSIDDFVIIAPGHFYGGREAATITLPKAGKYHVSASFLPRASKGKVEQFEAFGYAHSEIISEIVVVSVRE